MRALAGKEQEITTAKARTLFNETGIRYVDMTP